MPGAGSRLLPAFLDMELRLHEGCEASLVRIVRRLKLQVPATPAAK